MSTPVLICDDSSFARKQLARALPADWDISVSFAPGGAEALQALEAGKGEILFLDLNMPDIDGYAVLEEIRARGLSSIVIVVSGDIQPEAKQRVMSLGALEFIKKPVAHDELDKVLTKYGIRGKAASQAVARADVEVDIRDGYKEVANVAMGRAADLMARVLGAFVIMPIPNVNHIEVSELRMVLEHIAGGESVTAVSQGFIGAGIAGEALLIFNESSYTDIAELMNFQGDIDATVELELVMDIANILIGASLKGIADQLDISFSQGQPMVLGSHVDVASLISRNASRWRTTLAIEMGYSIEGRQVSGTLLLLFTEDSIKTMNDLIAYIIS